MSGDRKHDRNRICCKTYKANETEAINRRRKHAMIASNLQKKRARMQRRNMDVSGISIEIQRHTSLSRGGS